MKSLRRCNRRPPFWSLPPRGAWIEMISPTKQTITKKSRSPHGERGLKYRRFLKHRLQAVSLPPRGAWIEICEVSVICPFDYVAPPTGSVDGNDFGASSVFLPGCRSPHGERGLKLVFRFVLNLYRRSLPPRGAWIEITIQEKAILLCTGRSPHGERGLKSSFSLIHRRIAGSTPQGGR